MTALHHAVHNMPLIIYIALVFFSFIASCAGEIQRDDESVAKNAIDTVGSWLIGWPSLLILLLAYWWV
jgi:hypothetical protein